jgi:vacuolar-type H+-ATPase subunit H
MKKFFVISIFLVPLWAHAQIVGTYDPGLFAQCKDKAIEKRETILSKARLEYRNKNEALAKSAQRKFDQIVWYVDTSFKVRSKQILTEKQKEFKNLNDSMNTIRKGAEETYKAEVALCELNYLKKPSAKTK